MRRIFCIGTLTAAVLSVSCSDAAISERICVPPANADALTEMLLNTETYALFRLNDSEHCEPDTWITDALQSRMLARTMLRSVTWKRTGSYLEIQADYAKPQDVLREEKRMLYDAAQIWCQETTGESNAVRVLLAHDLLCRCCRYADDSQNTHSAAGALLEHSAACDGYAEAFALLMEYAEIPVMIVTGQAAAPDGKTEDHAWNMVRLSDCWYHIDCTWDDTDPDTVPAHTYFLCDDDAFRLTHKWDDKKYPPAQGGGYRYEVIVSEMADQIRKDRGEYAGYNPSQDPGR